MAEFWGLDAIAVRLGVCKNTVLAWHERWGLLMYPRRRGPRTVWYSNDSLLSAWEVARCRLAHADRYRHGRTLRARPKDSPEPVECAADVDTRGGQDG